LHNLVVMYITPGRLSSLLVRIIGYHRK
jgi:hypothetical protein